MLELGLQGKRFFFFIFPLFPTCSLQVPNGFSSSSQYVFLGSHCVPQGVFPIAPRFKPLCFAQSPPLLIYIGGPKEEALHHLSIESFILGSVHSFHFFFLVISQSNWPIAKKKKKRWTCEAPPTS
jgi:hypothetical protein